MFRMRYKPTEPKVKKITTKISLYDGMSLQEILAELPENINDYTGSVSISSRDSYGYTEERCEIILERDQTPDEIQDDLNEYNKKLCEYEHWQLENKEEIKIRLKKEEERKMNARSKRKKSLENEINKLKSQLNKME